MTPSFGSEHPVHIVSRKIKVRSILEKLTFDDRTTQQPCTFILNNDKAAGAPAAPLCHFWVVWAHILAQNTQSIYYLGKLSFEALWRSCLLTTEPPSYPLLFSEIMTGLWKRLRNHFAIFGLYEPIFWLRTPSPYTISGNLVSKHFEEVAFWRPNHLPTLYFSLK